MTGSDYQLINALIASVQGGISGLGIGESTQKNIFFFLKPTLILFFQFIWKKLEQLVFLFCSVVIL